ncbi:MAG TPA: hypothetical protein IAC64_11995 [Candidatus Caccomorpha excrementavium]|nr:hypothetical protein [Candidatus Caccomorpha excrementavium]
MRKIKGKGNRKSRWLLKGARQEICAGYSGKGAVRMRRKRGEDTEKGALFIEATLSLVTYFFFFLMLYSLIDLCRAQASIASALNQTAKEIAHYSYLYSLTGLNDSYQALSNSAQDEKDSVSEFVSDTDTFLGSVGEVFGEIQSLGEGGQGTIGDMDAFLSSIENVQSSGSDLMTQLTELAKSPEQLLFGAAKILATDGIELAKTEWIAIPITRALIQKNLVSYDGDSPERFLESLGVIPGEDGGEVSYLNGLSFDGSSLFPYGSDDITLKVTYQVRIVPLLPVDIRITMTHTAAAKGWMSGDATSDYTEIVKQKNDSLWTNATIEQRSSAIRSEQIQLLKEQGYYSVSSETYLHVYDPVANRIVMVATSNPFYGLDSIDQADREQAVNNLERLAAAMRSSTDGMEEIKVKDPDQGNQKVTKQVDPESLDLVIRLVIPEDAGALEWMQEAQAEANMRGVTVEYVQDYGMGLEYTIVQTEENGQGGS